jgi:hypothetical protein
VLQIEQEFALAHWDELSDEALKRKTREVAAGELPHAHDILFFLLRRQTQIAQDCKSQ